MGTEFGRRKENRRQGAPEAGRAGIFLWLWRTFRPFHGGLVLLCAGAAVLSLLQVGLAVLTRSVIDSGIAGDSRFFQLAAGLMAVIVLLVLVRGGLSWLSGRMTDCETARLRYELLNAAEHSSGERLQAYHSGTVLNRGIEDVKTLCHGVNDLLPGQIGNLTRLILSFAAVAMLSRPIAWVLLAAGLVAGGGAACARPVLKRRHGEVRRAEEEASAQMQEALQRVELTKGIEAEAEVLRRFQGTLRRGLSAKRRRRALLVSGDALLSAAIQAGTGCLLVWGAHRIYLGALTYGTLAALLQLLSLFRGPALGLPGLWSQLAALETAAESLRELLSADEGEADPTGPEQRPTKVTAAVFEKVTFSYPGDELPALENFSARFDLTDWTCLTGMSGRGKTTVLKLLLALYRPQWGRVYLETDRGEWPCGPDTRRFFAYVPQDYALFSGSIRDNLLLAAPGASEEDRRWALDTAQAGFVWALERQDGTELRENNAGLSMGQLQRLAIARAVLMRRPVLLLDECTSALDGETEQAVLRSLRMLGSGAILITHGAEALSGMERLNRSHMEEQG